MYIDAFHAGDTVHVIERGDFGRRVRKYPAPYRYYSEDPDGQFLGIDGKKLAEARFGRRWDLKEAVEALKDQGVQLYESDVKTEYRLLEEMYSGKPAPELRVAILDIEVYTKKLGFPRWENPHGPINSVSVHYCWLSTTVTVTVPPPGWSVDDLQSAVDGAGVPDVFVVGTEEELLAMLIDLLEEADVTTGWNSEKFDLPYIVSRIRQVLGGEHFEDFFAKEPRDDKPPAESLAFLNRLGGLGFPPRRHKTHDDRGSLNTTYTFPGKPHLDYIDIYKKFVLEPRDSLKLGEILEVELGVGKIEFEGSHDNLYETDPVTYVKYNRRDVDGIAELDKKLSLIDIANAMAHRACVLLSDATGSVSKIEQAILIRLHQKGKIARDKVLPDSAGGVPGAWVYKPTAGLYEWACNFDVKSLYPSIIRLLNMSQETLVGQFKLPLTDARIKKLIADGAEGAEIWQDFTGVLEYHAIVEEDPWQNLTLVLEDGTEIVQSADKWKKTFTDDGLLLSANGTVFSSAEPGIVALCVSEWFAERKEFQAKAKAAKKKMEELLTSCPIEDA